MIGTSWRRLIFPVVGLMTVATSPAYANIGLPMIAVIMPALWIMLIPVIFIESAVAGESAFSLPISRFLFFRIFASP